MLSDFGLSFKYKNTVILVVRSGVNHQKKVTLVVQSSMTIRSSGFLVYVFQVLGHLSYVKQRTNLMDVLRETSYHSNCCCCCCYCSVLTRTASMMFFCSRCCDDVEAQKRVATSVSEWSLKKKGQIDANTSSTDSTTVGRLQRCLYLVIQG